MARVEVRLFATLRQYAPQQGLGEALQMDVSGETTVADMIDRLQIPEKEVKRIFVNYRAVLPTHVLQDGDRVSIFPLVAGG